MGQFSFRAFKRESGVRPECPIVGPWVLIQMFAGATSFSHARLLIVHTLGSLRAGCQPVQTFIFVGPALVDVPLLKATHRLVGRQILN